METAHKHEHQLEESERKVKERKSEDKTITTTHQKRTTTHK